MKKILLSLSALLISMAGMAETFVKVTEQPVDWTGEYLVAYELSETQALIWKGTDAAMNFDTLPIQSEMITVDKADIVTISIAALDTVYSMYINGGTNDGKYVGYTGGKNGMSFGTEALSNTISMEDNVVKIKAGTAPSTLQFFSQTTNSRFRYYSSNQKAIQLYKLEQIEEGIVLKPTISGVEHFADSTVVTLTAEEGRKIFYTLDGTDPDTASAAYTVPFVLRDSAMVKAVAYNDTTKKFSEVSDKLFCKHALVSCAEAAALANGEWAFMKPFDVVYVVDGKGYIYIQDETGVMLIYSYDLTSSLKAGDHVEGMVGTSSPYNGLPEIKPTVTAEDLTITEGEVIAPKEYTAMPTLKNVNEYVVLKGVTITYTIGMTTSAASYPIAWANDTIVLRNQFKYVDTLALNTYDIYGFVGVYNSELQIYYLNAVPYVQITVTVNDSTLGTVTGAGAYAIGSEVTLTATPNDKCEFVNWSNESTENPLTFIAEEDVTLTANFQEITEGIIHTQAATKVEKVVENGQVIIIKNGIRYSALGVEL